MQKFKLTPIEQIHRISTIIYSVPYDDLTPYLQGIRDIINLLNNEEQEEVNLSDRIQEIMLDEVSSYELPF